MSLLSSVKGIQYGLMLVVEILSKYIPSLITYNQSIQVVTNRNVFYIQTRAQLESCAIFTLRPVKQYDNSGCSHYIIFGYHGYATALYEWVNLKNC